jgi:hypothetical protein
LRDGHGLPQLCDWLRRCDSIWRSLSLATNRQMTARAKI